MSKSRRKLVVIGSAAVVVILVGTLVGLRLTRWHQTETPAPTATAVATASVESSCGLSGTAGDSTSGATAATWEMAGAYSLPVSGTDGPGRKVDAGSWSCFTHTPSGAVLAGITISLRVNGVAENWQDVAREQTMPGTGQDALLTNPLPNAELVTIRGFDIAGYSPDRATIRYYLQSPAAEASCTTEVQWADGDWKLVLTDTGSTSSGCTQGPPQDFTPWGP